MQDTNALAVSIENELVATVEKVGLASHTFVCFSTPLIKSFQLQINQADSTKISVEESLHAKHGPLALARSRLQIRTSRPAQEQVCALLCSLRFHAFV